MHSFVRIDRLPQYVFAIVDELKLQARRAGEDIIDFGMGNPDDPPPSPLLISSVRRPISPITIAIPPPAALSACGMPLRDTISAITG
jgi:hypothetical protein